MSWRASLMRFAYYVAMPALVFLTIADESLHSLLEWRFLAAFGGGSMICFAAVMLVARIARGASLAASAMLAAAVSMTNTGFVALPILKTLYGKPGVLAAAVATVFVGAIMFPVLVVLIEIGRLDASRKIDVAALDSPDRDQPRDSRDDLRTAVVDRRIDAAGAGRVVSHDTRRSADAVRALRDRSRSDARASCADA